MQAIIITKCDEPQAWYINEVGNEYALYRETKDSYYVDDSLYVLKEDARIIDK